jgi:simple sugar transport system ATP-binding protein
VGYTLTQTRALLELRNIHKWFERVHAVNGVSLVIHPGEVVGLIGDNGAGKSTLVKIISGRLRPDQGEIFWEGRKVEISSVQDARRLGIETVHQERGLVDCFSVAKNVFLGREPKKGIGFVRFVDYARMREESEKVVRWLNLKIRPEQEVRFASGGEKQGVVVARAMYFKAQLIVLDEPTRALSVMGVERVLGFTETLKASGISCLFVTHSLRQIFRVMDRVVIIDKGEKKVDLEKARFNSADELEAKIFEIISGSEEIIRGQHT